jgi:hypothetical protein
MTGESNLHLPAPTCRFQETPTITRKEFSDERENIWANSLELRISTSPCTYVRTLSYSTTDRCRKLYYSTSMIIVGLAGNYFVSVCMYVCKQILWRGILFFGSLPKRYSIFCFRAMPVCQPSRQGSNRQFLPEAKNLISVCDPNSDRRKLVCYSEQIFHRCSLQGLQYLNAVLCAWTVLLFVRVRTYS